MGDVALCHLLLDARADVVQRSRAGSTAQAMTAVAQNPGGVLNCGYPEMDGL